MAKRKVPSHSPAASDLAPAGHRSGRGAASLLPYLAHLVASKLKPGPSREPVDGKQPHDHERP